MTPFAKIVTIGVAGILVFDIAASLASRAFGFPYVYATPGSFLMYAVVGYSVARIAPVSHGAFAALIVGVAEATVGWWLSWMLGAGRTKSGTVSVSQIFTAVITVALIAALIGAGAGAIARSRSGVDASAA